MNCLTQVTVFLREENTDAETYLSSQFRIFRFCPDSIDRMYLGMVLVMILIYNADGKIEGKLIFFLSYSCNFYFQKRHMTIFFYMTSLCPIFLRSSQ